MITKLLQHALYFLYWLIFFLISKAVFLLYHHGKTDLLTTSEVINVFIHGLYLDISFSGYISILPFFLFFLQTLIKRFRIAKIISGYTLFFVLVLSFLNMADLELYKSWGFKLDASALQYLHTPREMMAAAASSPIWLLLTIFILQSALCIFLYLAVFKKHISSPVDRLYLLPAILSFLLFAFLVVPIRGGFQLIPVNQSDVYFSDKMFANHAAVNVPWNFMHSILKKDFYRHNTYVYLPEKQALHYLDSLYPSAQHPFPNILTTQRPNIIFIILESYTSKLIGCLGGEAGVTPNLDKIAKEGMLFTNIYASGDRSEKGLVALLSGYPSQPATSIIMKPSKTEGLPHLDRVLKQQGYHSAYYYGGELSFANMKSYLLNAGYDKLISKDDFDNKDYNSKWGVHDHVLLERFLSGMKTEKPPFFYTLFTLSSHEPFEIPTRPKYRGNDNVTKFKNSFYYTDQAIGTFISQAKTQQWWDSTLIVMVADHGHPMPGYDANDRPSKFRIPLIFTGGALKGKGQVVNTTGSQTDIAYSLLRQMGLPAQDFKWSKNLLEPEAAQFAFYVFNNGFGFITPAGAVSYDNVSKKVIHSEKKGREQLESGKAYMQLSFEDFLKRR